MSRSIVSKITRLGLGLVAAALTLVVLGGQATAQPKHTIKIATLAPKGSSWMNAFERMDRRIRKETDGEVGLKIYPGGVMGDESAMVRKMRTGQLDGGALTSVGLGAIEKQLLVLQLPLVFRDYDELDYVRDKMSGTFQGMLDEKGFHLLHWGDVGFNYLFSNEPIKTPGDIKKTKPWVWDSDPVTKAVMEVANVNAVPLGVPEVMSSLSTGVIDAFLNSPYGAVALQWYTKAKYVTNYRLAVVIGGLIVTEKALDELPEEHRATVKRIADDEGKKLLTQIRKDNKQAIQTIQKAGIKVVNPDDKSAWNDVAEKAREELTGELFPRSLVDTMLGHLEDAR
jgi:TRAP-type C4-dicarboxylate transport system substrate-binding protein